MSRRIIPLAPVQSGGFSYGSKGFATHGIARESSARIRELLFPEELDGGKTQKRAREAAKVVTNPWIMAQLKFYGIGFKYAAKRPEMKELLMTSVKSGLCDSLPPRVKMIENKLRREYTMKNKEHVAIQSEHQAKIAELRMQCQRQQECAWDAKIQKHKAFVERFHGPGSPQPFATANIEGTYIVECNEISSKWPNANELSLKITNDIGNGCVGVFDFVVLKGVMEFDLGRQPHFLQPPYFEFDGYNGSGLYRHEERCAHELNNNAQEHLNTGRLALNGSLEGNSYVGNPFATNLSADARMRSNLTILPPNLHSSYIDDIITPSPPSLHFHTGGPAEQPHHENTKRSNLIPLPPTLHFGYTDEIITPSSPILHSRYTHDPAEQLDHEEFSIDPSQRSNPYNRNLLRTEPFINSQNSCALSALPPRLPFRWRGDDSSLDSSLLSYGDGKTGYLDFSDARCVTFDAEANLKFLGGKVKFRGFKVDKDALMASEPFLVDPSMRYDVSEEVH